MAIIVDPLLRFVLPTKAPPRLAGEKLPSMKASCRSKQLSHEQGIIHRDLKPANIKVLLISSSRGIHVWKRERGSEDRGSADVIVNEPAAGFVIFPEFSPDSRSFVYTSTETGTAELYMNTVPAGVRHRMTTDGGAGAAWVRDGTEVVFFTANAPYPLQVMKTTMEPVPSWGRPMPLFDAAPLMGLPGIGRRRQYDVSADGRRLIAPVPVGIVAGPGDDVERSRINIVLNWTEELKRMVPTN